MGDVSGPGAGRGGGGGSGGSAGRGIWLGGYLKREPEEEAGSLMVFAWRRCDEYSAQNAANARPFAFSQFALSHHPLTSAPHPSLPRRPSTLR